MKTKGLKKTKVNIVTLGCSKNLVDSEIMLTQLKGNNIDAIHESRKDDANVVVINTCGFIDNAKQESIDTILRYVDAKEEGKVEKVYVSGCLSQRYKEELKEEIPDVDAWFGTGDLPALLKKFKVDFKKELLGERITTTSSHYSYLKIAEGCNRPCSFCAIPLMRGKHISKSMEQIVSEAKSLISQGTKEILLIAQDSTYYGLDLYKKRMLAELMNRLADVEGLDWIRLHYAFPTGFPEDVLNVIADRPNICNYLDIPLQHASDHMLRMMRRGTTRAKTEALLEKMRNKVPGIAIRTTLIAGHPGETEDDFEEMLDFVEKNHFERLGIFTYSHEENTYSHRFKDNVPEKLKQERANTVMELQEEISANNNESKIGKEFKVLIDRFESGNFIGRTEYDSPEVDNEVIVTANDSYLSIGNFAQIRITDATAFDLYGEPVAN
ncbi:MAG: 30S ribosomal protein S12 methylthiotransferase RimO [Bacteroidota bacterium]